MAQTIEQLNKQIDDLKTELRVVMAQRDSANRKVAVLEFTLDLVEGYCEGIPDIPQGYANAGQALGVNPRAIQKMLKRAKEEVARIV
jgi:hypothetical protein